MSDFWKDQKIDIFKDSVSMPGLMMKYLFSNIPDTYFLLFGEQDKDMYYTMKDNDVGGPSIIFNRYHEKDKTKIQNLEMRAKGKEPKSCKKLWAMMPTRCIFRPLCKICQQDSTRRLEEDEFKKRVSDKMAVDWLEWEAYR